MRKAEGHPYLEILGGMHRQMNPGWYLEIGTKTGRSLVLSQTNSVAVSPDFRLKYDVTEGKRQVLLMQQESDGFFASKFLPSVGIQFDLAFLHGMKRYEFLLRDFINAERFMARGAQIVFRDCLPWTADMATRDRSTGEPHAWAGDVWKVVPILRTYRPDLNVRIYDASPTGLVVVDNLDPESKVLRESYDDIRSSFDGKSDCEAVVNSFEVTPTSECPLVNKPKALNFAIKLPVPRPRVQHRWGDYHFGVGLMSALQRAGHRARVQTRRDWGVVETPDEVDIVLRGGASFVPTPDRRTLFWLMSTSYLTDEEAAGGSYFFVAGQPALDKVVALVGADRASLLPQAFDPEKMAPPEGVAERGPAVFVGIARRGNRPMVRFAVESKSQIQLWGGGWEETEASEFLMGDRVPNEGLSEVYRSASAVLNDHTRPMRFSGIPSNRIFDGLACGTPVITDDVGWFPEDIRPFIYVVKDKSEFKRAIDAARSESPDRQAERIAFAQEMRHTHSFDARAAEIVKRVTAL